jgi:nicotinamidase-related amidase
MSVSTGVVGAADVLGRVAAAVQGSGGTVVTVSHGIEEPVAGPGRAVGHAHARPVARPSRLPVVGSAEWQPDLGFLAGPIVRVGAIGLAGTYGSLLEHHLRAAGIDRVVLGGFASELTVDTTVRALNDQGFECLTLVDGCAPIDPATGEHALSSVTMSGGIFGAIGSSADLLAALAADDGGHDQPGPRAPAFQETS